MKDWRKLSGEGDDEGTITDPEEGDDGHPEKPTKA